MDKVSQVQGINSPLSKEYEGYGVRYVILDGAFDDNLHAQIYRNANNRSPIWAPLTLNTPYAEMGTMSPCLLQIEEHYKVQDYASELLEQSDAGCVVWLEDSTQWPVAIEHCQSLLTVKDNEQGDTFFRFFEPRWLEPLFETLEPGERSAFLGPFAAIAWRNERGWRLVSRLEEWEGLTQAPGWLSLDTRRLQSLEQARLPLTAARLAESYRAYLPDDGDRVVLDILNYIKPFGYSDLESQERWLRLHITRPKDFLYSAEVQNLLHSQEYAKGKKLDEIEALPFA
jgi:hypothetical protein